jgi:hypothetical protein
MTQEPFPILIYLAGPIDDVTREVSHEWREQIEDMGSFVVFYSPAHAFIHTSEDNFPVVDYANRQMIDLCHGLLANLDEGAGFGTIREIEHARRTRKPVTIIDPNGRYSKSRMTYDLAIAPSIDEGLTSLLTKIAEARNQPPMGFPFGTIVQLPGPEEEGG